MAGVSKKSSLRSKLKKPNLTNKINQFKQDNLESDASFNDNPYLKLAKQTKREKRDIKSNNFSERLSSKITFNTSSSISKSSKRRISKKQKEQLKPKLTELLTTLPSTTTASTSSASASLPKNTNAPNAAKVSGNKKILQIENANFKNVLKNESFKKSPFESLREMIKNKEELRK